MLILLVIAGVTFGFNLFHFPYYENDEGTYMSQAYSLLSEGKLAPYTYWYDHAPAGWILIAIWVTLTGGFFTFGPSVNSGRILMLVLHVLLAAILLSIARRLKKSDLAGAITVLIFTLSPLGIYFQRRVLLDNIMIFWVFVSLYFLLKKRLKLSHVLLSSLSFGVAVLSKENAIFFTPVFIYLVWSRSHVHFRKFAFFSWLFITGLIVSLYFLYALLKNELFPVGFMGDTSEHVSLITTLKDQYSRGEPLPFWDQRSDFYQNFKGWLDTDMFTIVGGIFATVLNLVWALRSRKTLFVPLLSILFWAFLMRGKLVINFYIAPIIPILALNIGILISRLVDALKRVNSKALQRLGLAVAVSPLLILLFESTDHYVKDEVTPQVNAIEWVKNNLSTDTKLVIDDAIYVDLHASRFPGDPVYPYADWSWKVEKDPEVFYGKLGGDWKNIEYIILSHEMLKQIKDDKFNFIQKSLDNSFAVAEWKKDSTSYIDVNNYVSTNGDWMAVYKVNDRERILLSESWQYYKSNFIVSYGQVIDPSQNRLTTSEGQSYAMLRAVWQNDKLTFDGVWKWTQDHLQYRTQDKLLSWQWVKDGDTYRLGDSASASDADLDTALALLFAYKRWGSNKYLADAQEILSSIWENEVKVAGNRYVLVLGTSGFEQENVYLVNPSYFSPAWYRIFAEADPVNPWLELAEDSYEILSEIPELEVSPFLPPNWITVNKLTGKPSEVATFMDSADQYGYDAFRLFWRVALDQKWFNSPEANKYLSYYEGFWSREWQTKKDLAAVYSLQGEPMTGYPSLSTAVGSLSLLSVLDRPEAKEIFEKYYSQNSVYEDGYWGDKNNYYDQNWAWLGSALYFNLLPNLWTRS